MTISSTSGFREIPFNYTSADDARVVSLLLGGEVWERLQELRSRRVTGRSARLLMRVLGEVFIHQRNAYLFEELVASPRRKKRLFANLAADLAAIERLGLGTIPRGAGTGLTGGAIPLRPRCVVVNCEALNRIGGIDRREFRSGDGVLQGAVMTLEAGVVTERAMEVADEHGLVFATDPTSAWACTIGGNIAENAGGKTAVLWGTCIDNLLAWKTAMPGGSTWTAARRLSGERWQETFAASAKGATRVRF